MGCFATRCLVSCTRSSMLSRVVRPGVIFLLLLLLVATSTSWVTGQAQQPLSLEDLESMSEEELELICIERGFELIQDESGEPLTHSDYVDAARRCLAIEEDMNEILEQNPELADELLSEIDRMKEEKQRLEHEREVMVAEKERLEEQLQKNQNKKPMTTRTWGEKSQQQSEQLPADSTVSASETTSDSNTTFSEASDSTQRNPLSSGSESHSGAAFVPHKTTPSNLGSTASDVSNSDAVIMDDATKATDDGSESEGKTLLDDCIPANSSSAAATIDGNDDNKSADFSLRGFIQEIMSEFEKDVHRVTSLLLPVIKPLFNAGNTAWKYLKIVFQSAKDQWEKRKSSNDQEETS